MRIVGAVDADTGRAGKLIGDLDPGEGEPIGIQMSGSFEDCLAGLSAPVKVDLNETESHLGNHVGSQTWLR